MLLVSEKLVLIETEAVELWVTMWKRFTPTLATVWHKIFWQDACLIENKKLWPLSSKRYNSKTQCLQPHILIFFLISSNFSLDCAIAYLVVWTSQKSYNINMWHNFVTAPEIRRGLLPNNRKGLLQNNNTSHSCQNSF